MRIDEFVKRLHNVRRAGKGFTACCPAHEDRVASLSISEGQDGRVLLKCHAGCSVEQVVEAMGLKLADLFPTEEKPPRPTRRIVETYDYIDEHGILQSQTVRFYPKGFAQRRPDGSGNWIWNLQGVTPVLYGLPELIQSDIKRRVCIPEGERDVNTLRDNGEVATCNQGGAGKWRPEYNKYFQGRTAYIFPDNDKPNPQKPGELSPGERHARDVARQLMDAGSEVYFVRLPGAKDVTEWMEQGHTKEELLSFIESNAIRAQTELTAEEPRTSSDAIDADDLGGAAQHDDSTPKIIIDPDEHRVIEETVKALRADADLYSRGGMLVRVLRHDHPTDGILRAEGSPTISIVPPPNLRERISRCARFYKVVKGELKRAHIAAWLVNAIDARGEWAGIRPLAGISDSPILRPDGSICQTPGYDAATGVLYSPAQSFPVIPAVPLKKDAIRALESLLEIVCDFRFESPEHRAAWLAAMLTPLARFAFNGPSPLFLIDANVRGAGKGLLAQTIGCVVIGREMPVSTYSNDSEEMRKKLTAIALAGDRMILFDNVDGNLGNDALDRALTSTRWKDRILGRSQEVELPLMPAWYATGNNVQVGADTCRRVIHIRLDVLEERPEERSDFRHPELIPFIATHRGHLLTDALTILVAYCQAGRPKQASTPFGSFEGWSSLVREAVIWVGLPDPCLTRTRLAESSDTTESALAQFIEALTAYDPSNKGFICSVELRKLYGEPRPNNDASVQMRAAVENMVGCPPGKAPNAQQLGNRLKSFRRRVVANKFLDTESVKSEHGWRWRVRHATSRVSQSQPTNRDFSSENAVLDGGPDSADSTTGPLENNSDDLF